MQSVHRARSRGVGPLGGPALVAISLLALGGFVGLAVLVRLNRTARIDAFAERVAERVDGPAVELLGGLLTAVGRIELTLLLAAGLAALLWWRGRRGWALALLLIFATVGVEVLSKELLLVPRDEVADVVRTRPRRLPREVAELFTDDRDAPYPSGHVARAVFLGGLLGWRVATRRWPMALRLALGAAIVVFLALMGFTRVTEGEHPFVDVIGGTLLALALLPPAWWLIARDRPGARR